MPYMLRKSKGPFSAGTRVDVTENQDGSITVEVIGRTKHPEDEVFDADWDDVVKLRSRTDTVPSVTRQARKDALKKLFGETKKV